MSQTNAEKAKGLLETIAPDFQVDCSDYWREFSRYAFCLANILPLLEHGAHVLELGAGGGVIACALHEAGMTVTAADQWQLYQKADTGPLSERRIPSMGERDSILARLSARGIAAAEINMFAEQLPFPSDSFDMVSLLAVIEHMPNSPRSTLEECRRVLKPGGILIVEVPNIAALRNRLKLLIGRTIHFPLSEWYYADPYCGHHRELARSELAAYADYLDMTLVWIHSSNSSFFNTKNPDGSYDRAFRLNSMFQCLKAVYLAFCAPFPGLQYQILAAMRKQT